MATAQRNSARLDFRLASDIKEIIEKAACVSGQSMSEFAISTLLREAQDILEKHHTIRLSDRDRDRFLAALDAEDEPNEALKAAFEKYKQSGLWK
jgi:uncharacterized protein (DUF1778 family)